MGEPAKSADQSKKVGGSWKMTEEEKMLYLDLTDIMEKLRLISWKLEGRVDDVVWGYRLVK